MEDVRNTPMESSSPSGVSLPNVQPNGSSQMSRHTNGNMSTEARDSAADGSKLGLKEDSRGIDYPSLAGNSVPITTVKTGDTENPEMPEPCRDESSESTPSSVSHVKPNHFFELPNVKLNESSEYIPSKESAKNATKTPTSSPQVRSENHLMASDDIGQSLAKISTVSNGTPTSIDKNRALIDTASPFKSVKQAVSRFGGILDWKAHQAQTLERRKFIDQELEKVHEEIPLLKRQSEAAEVAKQLVLKELDSTKQLVEQLKLNLDRAQTEEQQAKQDSELVKLRVEEMEQGIADDSSIAAKAQLEVARSRHAAAVSELQTVTAELEQLHKDYSILSYEKETALKKAEYAVLSFKEVEKTVEGLTIELMTVKESLDAAHVAHLEAEEHRIGATMATEQDTLQWEKDVKEAEDELWRLNQQVLYAMDLQSKLDAATALLHDLKSELAAYMESKLEQEADKDQILAGGLVETGKSTHGEIQSAITSTRKELDEVKLNLEKAIADVDCLKAAATSLKSELDTEKSELSTTRQREGMASIAVTSLETELNRTKSEMALAQMKEKEAREQMVEVPRQLQEAAREADLAKKLAKIAHDELWKAREEAQQAKAEASTIQSRLHAAQKEIEAAKASEKLAFAAINALKESESVNIEESSNGVTLSLEEYYSLSKRAHESEEQANMKVASALSQIDIAKESELKILNKLKEVNHERDETREALELALQKAEKAKEGKLAVEQDLRKWREENEQRRKNTESNHPAVVNPTKSLKTSFEDRKDSKASELRHSLSCKAHIEMGNPGKSFVQESNSGTDSSPEVKTGKKKKKSLFPRIYMFLTRKRSHGKTT